ncbi:MAG: diaminopimelate decarboxylase [Hyphomicrobiaceae bacterium]
MHHFSYKNGILHAEDVPVADIAAEVGTPFYCYSTATLQRHYQVLEKAFGGQDALICYAMKANSNQAVLKTLAKLGAGMDVVSEGELRRALAAGVPANKIIFAGVGKSRAEMAFALKEGILGFNVESVPELHALSDVADEMGLKAPVSIRVNPDVDAKTHEKISTGKSENKFGVPYVDALSIYAQAAALPGIDVAGIHMHIGSQITDLAPYRDAFRLLHDLVVELRAAGHNLRHLDIGGGLGVPYEAGKDVPPHPQDYAAVVGEELGALGLKIVMEPGRVIAGNAGILVSRVLYSKIGAERTFTIVDASMAELLRPTLYEAYQEVLPEREALNSEPETLQDVVGPVCESGDYLAKSRMLPPFKEGDLLAVMTAGAYGAVMASTYNSRLLVPEVLVSGDRFGVVRERPTYDDLISQDIVPDWV